ncbi:hypothetical protein PQR67_27195 [Paraburkholderia fungorum]|uniref:hypothetical protein n=1 Tax=Paraburkholderia fungorum TaxID=134537 RepID=UPI0038BCFFD3
MDFMFFLSSFFKDMRGVKEQRQTCGQHAAMPGSLSRALSGARSPTFDLNPPALTNALNKSLHAVDAYIEAAAVFENCGGGVNPNARFQHAARYIGLHIMMNRTFV